MPFGLRGAPATFQRMVDRLLDGFNDFASAYIDDIIIFSGTWEDHLYHLRRIQETGLTLRRKKWQFGMSRPPHWERTSREAKGQRYWGLLTATDKEACALFPWSDWLLSEIHLSLCNTGTPAHRYDQKGPAKPSCVVSRVRGCLSGVQGCIVFAGSADESKLSKRIYKAD